MQQAQEDQPHRHRYQPDHTQLLVGQLGHRLEGTAPGLRRDKRQDALEHEHQRARGQQNGGD